MDRRQRKTVNFFQRYVINDQAVKTAEDDAKAQTAKSDLSRAVSIEVNDQLNLRKLYEELDFENEWDRRLQYEVTGIKFDGDNFGSDSDSNESCKSSSSGSDGEGNKGLLTASRSSANALFSSKVGVRSSKSKIKRITADK